MCPVNAIEMQNKTGWYRPHIDVNKCIECDLCKRICPANNKEHIVNNLHMPQECYAAWCKDDIRHYESASGGLGTLISEKFIESGGIVAGVKFDNKHCEAMHLLAEKMDEVSNFSKSKYIQSNKTGFWKSLFDADINKPVLFIGVGCEVNAFKKFIEINRNKLGINRTFYCIDLLCRGGASSLLFKQHLCESKLGSNIENVTFRGGKHDCKFTVYKNGEIVYQEGQFEDIYFSEFMRHSIYASSCYECPFARSERGGDITLADFWGLSEEIALKAYGKGINLLLVNTKKGHELLNSINDEINLFERPLEEAVAGNETLYSPTEKPIGRDELWNKIPKVGFHKAAKQVYPLYYQQVERQKFKRMIRRKLVRAIPKLLYNYLKRMKDMMRT